MSITTVLSKHFRHGRWRLSRFLQFFLFSVVFLGAATTSQAQALSGSYTICPKGGGCDYSTISDAANDLANNGISGPVTFTVGTGSYDESVYLGFVSGASKTNTITFKGTGSTSHLYTSSSSYALSVSGEFYIIEKMKVEQQRDNNGDRALEMKGSYNIIRNCILVSPSTWNWDVVSIYITGGNNLVTENRILGGNRGFWADQWGQSGSEFTKNRVTQSMDQLMNVSGGTGTLVADNYIDSAAGGGSIGLFVEGENEGQVLRNTIMNEGIASSGIFINLNANSSSSEFLIANNFFYNNNSNTWTCVELGGWNGAQNVNIKFVHNTIQYDGSNGRTLYKGDWNANGYTIANNIFSKGGTGQVVTYDYLDAADVVKGNNYYNTGGNFIFYYGSDYTSFSTWQSAALANGHGEGAMNMVVNYAPGQGLHLDKNKPAPFGPYIGIATDYDGDNRCKFFPTAGADESNYGKGNVKPQIFGKTTVVSGSPAVFYASVKRTDPVVVRWYIDNVYQGDSLALETTKLGGTSAKLKLVAEGCSGKDSSEVTITITAPTQAPVTNFLSDKNTILMGDIISFTDLSTNGPSKWEWKVKPDSTYDFGLKVPTVKFLYGDYTTHRWIGRFNYPGKYEVCLTTSNLVGQGNTECKTDYIDVIPAVWMGNTSVIKDPQGYLYDNGGPSGAYDGFGVTRIQIDPCADSVYLVFKMFDLHCGNTYLRIYEGDDKTGRELHPCTNNKNFVGPGLTGGFTTNVGCASECLPGTDTFAAKGKMTIVFDNDWGNGSQGFEAFWWSKPKNQAAPVAKFSATDTICTNGTVFFTNETVGDEVEYQWDLDGDPAFFESNGKNTTWPYFFPGKYKVTLVARNCGGVDTFVKEITVVDPPAPVTDFMADNTNPTVNDVVFFSPIISECVDNYKWVFTKKYGKDTIVFVNGSSGSTPNPQVIFPDTGCYHVQLIADNVTGSDDETKSCYITVKNPYCAPSVSTVISDIGISAVSVADMYNSSSQGKEEYQNFTPRVSAKMEIGVKYTVSVERTSNSNKANRSVWIDWNADGDFDDAQEHLGDENNSSALKWDLDFTVPPIAVTGATKMRVAINHATYANKACGQNEYGEYEDYRIYVSQDLTPPVITLLGKDTVVMEQGYTYTDAGATAKDNLDGDITADIDVIEEPTFYNMIAGTYRFHYDVDDAAGNAAKRRTRVVIVKPDATAPALRVAKPDTVRIVLGQPFTPPAVLSADDLVDGDRSGAVSITGNVVNTVVDTTTLIYWVDDDSGNDTIVERTIIVMDTVKPVMTLTGNDTVYHEIHTPYTDAGVSFNDNYYSQAELSKLIVSGGNVDVDKFGTYTLSYSLTDPSGNGPVTLKRTVIVADSTAPVLTMRGNDEVILDVHGMFLDQGITIQDNHYQITEWDTAGTFYQEFPDGKADKLGDYTVIYEVTDGMGNKSSIVRTVKVVDREAPVISLEGAVFVNVCRWAQYTDEGYTLSDNYDVNNDIDVEEEGTFVTEGTDKSGAYGLRYKATDQSGNVSYSEWRYINVKAENDPLCVSGIAPGDMAASITVFPNPNSGKFTIRTELPATDQVRISVVNALGQEVAVVGRGTLGGNTYQVDLSAQANGLYFIKVVNERYTVTKQVMISK